MPEFMPKSKFADYLEFFSIFQDIPHLTSTEMLPNPTYDPIAKRWNVKICHDGKLLTVQPKHLVLATGVLGSPNIPHFEGMDIFKGPILHTDTFKNANDWKGKKIVVVGAVSADLVSILYYKLQSNRE